MDGIYNTIALDGQGTGKKTVLTAAINERVYFNATQRTQIDELKISNILPIQSGTPSPTSRVAIGGRNTATYRKAQTATASGTNYSASLGRTLFGGEVDFRAGVLNVVYPCIQLSSAYETWSVTGLGTSSQRFWATIDGMASYSAISAYDSSACKCTHATWTTSTSAPFGNFYFLNGRVYFTDSGNNFASLAEFTAWLDSLNTASTMLQITYPLAEPRTYTISKQSVTAYDGDNYFWSTIGDIELTVVDPFVTLKRPNDFAIKREEVYAGEYTTCTGAIRADRIGWKYSDITLELDELTPDALNVLSGMYGTIILYFTDSDGDHEEEVIKTGFTNTPTRYTEPDGRVIWKDCGVSLRFINAYD